MRRSRSRTARAALASLASLAAVLLASCGGSDDAAVTASRSEATGSLATDPSAAPASTVLPTVPPAGGATTVSELPGETTTTSTTLVGPDLPTTTVGPRRLYEVSGVIGVFPVTGTICALDTTGAAGALVAPEGSTFDEPDVGTITYGGEVTFAATSGSEGTYTYSIEAYATSFTGYGTYRIGWLNGGQSGGMDLYETSGHASNPVVDQDDTSDQELAFSVVAIGNC